MYLVQDLLGFAKLNHKALKIAYLSILKIIKF